MKGVEVWKKSFWFDLRSLKKVGWKCEMYEMCDGRKKKASCSSTPGVVYISRFCPKCRSQPGLERPSASLRWSFLNFHAKTHSHDPDGKMHYVAYRIGRFHDSKAPPNTQHITGPFARISWYMRQNGVEAPVIGPRTSFAANKLGPNRHGPICKLSAVEEEAGTTPSAF